MTVNVIAAVTNVTSPLSATFAFVVVVLAVKVLGWLNFSVPATVLSTVIIFPLAKLIGVSTFPAKKVVPLALISLQV